MNDEEIMKKFNEKFGTSEQNVISETDTSVTPYKASSNLNTSNVESSNINYQQQASEQKLNINDLMSTDTNTYYPNSNTISSEQKFNSSETPKYDSNVNYNYVSTYNTQKQKKPTIKLTGENLIFIVIVIILFAFILITPTIYDFIRQIKMR